MSIAIEQLSFQYHTNPDMYFSIENVTISQGECVVLCGKSGSGKSTFLRIINGLIPDYYEGELTGKAWFNYQPLGSVRVEDSAYSIGSVFQNPATQFFHDIIEDELVFPCENQCIPADVMRCRLQQTVALFQLEKLLPKSLYHVSGGQRQKIAIATAFMQQPYLIVMDEPTANLDKQGVAIVKEMITQLKQAGVTVIIAEQRLAYLRDIADRYFYFEQGKLTRQWDCHQIQHMTDGTFHQLGLRSSLLDTVHTKLTDKKQLFKKVQQTNLPCLRLEKVLLQYGQTVVKKIPQLKFPLGQVIGIMGANGVGKTTLIKAIAGIQATQGQFYWQQHCLSEKERIVQSIFVLQEVRMQLFSDTVDKEIELGADTARVQQYKQQICQTLGLTHLLDKHPMTLSGGQQQRVMIANALLSQKKLFIFDEVTSGLCYENMQHVAELIRQVCTPDTLVLVVSHDEEFLSYVADMVYDMEML